MPYKLRNLGKASLQQLSNSGISSVIQLRELGSVAAFLAVKEAGFKPTLNLLWAIEGALTDRDWREVAKNDRLSLLTNLEILESSKIK